MKLTVDPKPGGEVLAPQNWKLTLGMAPAAGRSQNLLVATSAAVPTSKAWGVAPAVK